MSRDIHCDFRENSPAVIIGRVTADNATGAATGVDGEGYFVKQADLSSISCTVYDEDAEDAVTSTPSITLAAIIDTPVTDNVLFPKERDPGLKGYNFKFTVPRDAFPTGDHNYRVEFKFTPTAGEPWIDVYRGLASKVLTS